MALEIQPITFREARAFIDEHHRHHRPPQGHKFSIAVTDGIKVCGVVVIGRPIARMLDDKETAEVTRCCTDGTKNACSMLYGAAWRAARAMGYKRIITYTLAEESGTSLLAAGWTKVSEVKGQTWSRPSRLRTDKHPTVDKILWEKR